MKTLLATIMAVLLPLAGYGQTAETPNVYFTSEISPESLVKIYHALGKEATGRVAIKISTGESAQTNYLRPEFMRNLVEEVNGTIVECNTAYSGNRSSTESHRRAIEERGYNEIAPVDIMDEEGSIDIPMADASHLQFDRVGSHIANYDFLINLAHFKGHAMGGFGGVLKNQSIGMASREGKTLIHTAGEYSKPGFRQPPRARRIPRIDGCSSPSRTQLFPRQRDIHQRDEQLVGRLRLRQLSCCPANA